MLIQLLGTFFMLYFPFYFWNGITHNIIQIQTLFIRYLHRRCHVFIWLKSTLFRLNCEFPSIVLIFWQQRPQFTGFLSLRRIAFNPPINIIPMSMQGRQAGHAVGWMKIQLSWGRACCFDSTVLDIHFLSLSLSAELINPEAAVRTGHLPHLFLFHSCSTHICTLTDTHDSSQTLYCSSTRERSGSSPRRRRGQMDVKAKSVTADEKKWCHWLRCVGSLGQGNTLNVVLRRSWGSGC